MTRTLAGLVLVLSLLAAAPVRADPVTETVARAIFKEGNQMLDEGDFVGALERFRAAYQKWPNAKILLNTGAALRKLGRFAEAADTYDVYLHDPAADAKHKLQIAEILAELDAKVATLRLGASETGARITVDGKEVGESPAAITVRVEPGNHVLIAEKAGFKPSVMRADFRAGDLQTLTLALVADVATGPVVIVAPPAPPAPREWPLALVERPLSLHRGMVEGGLDFAIRESPDYTDSRPTGLVPRLAVGVTDRATIAVSHVNGICIGGDAAGCPNGYDDVTLDAIFALMPGATAVALHGGVTAVHLRPFLMGLNLGVLAHAQRGRFGVRFDPRVLIAVNGRQDSDNRDAVFLPLDLELQLGRGVLIATTRLAGPFDSFTTYSELRFDLTALLAISRDVDAGVRYSFDNVIHDGSTDLRTIDVLMTLRK